MQYFVNRKDPHIIRSNDLVHDTFPDNAKHCEKVSIFEYCKISVEFVVRTSVLCIDTKLCYFWTIIFVLYKTNNILYGLPAII